MPELPEAETIARSLDRRLAGARLDRVVYIRRDILRGPTRQIPPWLANAEVEGVTRRGKRVVVSLRGRRGLLFYLGMTGKLEVREKGDALRPHTHMRLRIRGNGQELRFCDYRRFGGVQFFDMADGTPPAGLAELGVEPLEMSVKALRRIVMRRRQIKSLLMDQRVLAGLGNIYCDEALHRAGVHPLEIAADIDGPRVGRLCRAIKSVLRAAINAEGSTIINYQHPDGPGRFQQRLLVYGNEGKPCRQCRCPIIKIAAAGRSTHLCPRCQPAPLFGFR